MEQPKNRLGFIGIVVEHRQKTNVEAINRILSEYGDMIMGRIGVPDRENDTAVIGLIIEGTTDRLGALTGKLGGLAGVQVKSALTSRKNPEEE